MLLISGRQHLCSAATGTLLVPRVQTATRQRSFTVNRPALRSPDLSESAFKWALKTHLFSTARRHWDVCMILAPDINIQTCLLTYWGGGWLGWILLHAISQSCFLVFTQYDDTLRSCCKWNCICWSTSAVCCHWASLGVIPLLTSYYADLAWQLQPLEW